MHGLHLTADLRECTRDSRLMTDCEALRGVCLAAVAVAGLSAVGELFHRFDAASEAQSGVTGMVLLSESHLAVHTWPEIGAATLDVYVCNRSVDNSGRAETVLEALVEAFGARRVERHALQRGERPS